MFTNNQLYCADCGKIIEVGEPFMATATYPARSSLQADAVTGEYLEDSGEVLCRNCTVKRIGQPAADKLQGAIFAPSKIAWAAKASK